jgi:hypothetical protein
MSLFRGTESVCEKCKLCSISPRLIAVEDFVAFGGRENSRFYVMDDYRNVDNLRREFSVMRITDLISC